jgi:M6 family metalloprotease-like protein
MSALCLLWLLQDPLVEAERERIRSRPPLDAPAREAYALPAASDPLPARASLTLALVPLDFADVSHPEDAEFGKRLVAPLADYYRRASGGRLRLSVKVWPPLRIPVPQEQVKRADLEGAFKAFVDREGVGVPATADALLLAAAGPLPRRGSPLWPHQGAFGREGKATEYALVSGEPPARVVAAAAHELMHLLGLEDKYDDAKADVGADCILGTGFDPRALPPPCAECRLKLGWAAAVEPDLSRRPALVLDRDLSKVVRVPLSPDGSEALLLECRDRLLIWHTGGGKKIELVGRFPTESSDRLTPLSDPPFRGRDPGARKVWITDIRVEDGRAWFRIGPDAPLTPLEERRRLQVGRRLGD